VGSRRRLWGTPLDRLCEELCSEAIQKNQPQRKETLMFENKLVAVINKSCESGVGMNVLAHMSFGLGQIVEQNKALLCDYIDKDGVSHPAISSMPFIVLSANSNKIRNAIQGAKEQNILCVNFTDTMTGGTYLEQLENTKNRAEEDLQYYGAVFFGPWDAVTELTKKFSLWR
jgi:hypothetical protein